MLTRKKQRRCTIRHQELQDETVCLILRNYDRIAVVGLSHNPWRDSHYVATYLMRQGYVVIPVNPVVPEVLGLVSYPDLLSAPRPIEVVEIFRRDQFIPRIITEAIGVGAKAIWIEGGAGDEVSVARARQAGLRVVTHRCMMIEHDLHIGSR